MRSMIASDLHGSAYYTEKIVEIYAKEHAQRLILLGDLLYHGPRNPLPKDYDPMRVAGILNDMRTEIFAVRGNCDSEVDQMVLDFPIGADCMLWDAEGRFIFATHGHLYDPVHSQLHPGDVFLQGHTHIPRVACCEGIWQLNPGSAALPKNGFEPSYMLFDGGTFSIRTLDGREMMTLDLTARSV